MSCMRNSYKILVILLGICFGSLCFASIVTGVYDLIYPLNSALTYHRSASLIDYLYYDVNSIVGNFFEIMVTMVLIYSAFGFRKKIIRLLSWKPKLFFLIPSAILVGSGILILRNNVTSCYQFIDEVNNNKSLQMVCLVFVIILVVSPNDVTIPFLECLGWEFGFTSPGDLFCLYPENGGSTTWRLR